MVPLSSVRISRVLTYSGSYFILNAFNLQDCHLLWFTFPDNSNIRSSITCVVLTPWIFLSKVWALPLSLATTHRIVFTFFSSGYLDVSVPRVPSA